MLSSENPFSDIFSLIANGENDPPAPLLTCLLLRGNGQEEEALSVYRRLLSAEEAEEVKTIVVSRRLVHLHFMIAEVLLRSTSSEAPEALAHVRSAVDIYEGSSSSTPVPEGGSAPPTICADGVTGDEDRRELARLFSLMARINYQMQDLPEAVAKWKRALLLLGDDNSEEVADALFFLAQLHLKGFGLEPEPAPGQVTVTQEASTASATTTTASSGMTADTLSIVEAGDEATVASEQPLSLEERKVRAAIEKLEKSLDIEMTLNGADHCKTLQVRTLLEEISKPLAWPPPGERPQGGSMLDRLLRGDPVPELANLSS